MASASGGFRFFTKKNCFKPWFWLSNRQFRKSTSDDFLTWYFFFFDFLKLWNYPKKCKNTSVRSLVVLPGCFWKLDFTYDSAAEFFAFFCYFQFFSRSQILWNCNFVNKKSGKWYFFFCDNFIFNVKFQKQTREWP